MHREAFRKLPIQPPHPKAGMGKGWEATHGSHIWPDMGKPGEPPGNGTGRGTAGMHEETLG